MTSGQCFFNIDHIQCFFSQQALCLCLFPERQEQSFPAAFCPVAPHCGVWVPPCHRLQITSYHTVSGRITNTHTLCHQNFKISPGLIWSHQPAVHHQRACLRGGRVLWGVCCHLALEWLQCWCSDSSLWSYKSILTHICRKRIAPHFIQSGAAFFWQPPGLFRWGLPPAGVWPSQSREGTQSHCSGCSLLGPLPRFFGT